LVDIFHYPFPLYRLFFCPANRVWGHPGKTTSDYMAKAMHQLAGTGSLALALIALAPILLGNTTGLAVQLGGTSLLIVVSVATELMISMDSYVTVRHHKGFLS